MKLLRKYAVFLLAFFALFRPATAQEIAASLNGVVSDTTGAAIVDASIEVRNKAIEGFRRSAKTDKDGTYTLTNLPPATYVVTVSSPGFKSQTIEEVTLFVAEKRSVNARLPAGSVDQIVTVQEDAVSVDTTSSAQTGTISGTQVRELELNNRNFEQLVILQTGVVNGLGDEVGFGLNNATAISVNGARTGANNWTVDGADINDSGSNGTLLNVPSVDAIQEFSLARGSYDAGYGRSGGAQVLVATKQGTSQYHGDVYEFSRNNIFNANSYFAKHNPAAVQPRGIERYNNYGFTLGGPVTIPKLFNTSKDKLFFFWSEEWRKVTSPNTQTNIAPSTAMLNGVVAGQVTAAPPGCVSYNAIANQSTISPSCYSQNAKVYVANVYAKFPANGNGVSVNTFSSLQNSRQDIVRLDYNLNEKIHLFARAMQDETPQSFPDGLFAGQNFPGLVNTTLNAPGQNVVGNLSYTINPKLVNEAEFAYSQGEIKANLSNAVANSPTVLSALTNNYAYADPYGRIPTITFLSGITGFVQGSAPYTERNLDRTFFDNVSASLGKHSLRTGITISQMLKTENGSSGNPSFQFNTWQDFLLGNVLVYSQPSRDIIPNLHYNNIEAFVQDDWKVTSRLTLNLGLRWSYFPSPTDVNNTLNNFDPTQFDRTKVPLLSNDGNFLAGQGQLPATYTNGLIFPQGSACSAAKAISSGVTCSPYGSRVNPNSNLNFGPRFGFAFDPYGDGRTSLRGGFGTFYDRTLNGIWEQNAFSDPPLVQTSTVNNTKFDQPLAGTSSVSLGPNGITGTGNPAFKVPLYATYNLSVQQALSPSTVFEMAYVGSQGRHLLGEQDLNQPTLQARAANPTVNVNLVRPYLGYSYMKSRIPMFTSNYNSLQVSLTHRVTKGLTAGIAYTWSKNLSTQSADRGVASTNTYNPQLDYGLTALNTPQVFVANYVYTLPFYRTQHGLVGHTLGGWEVSGITTVQSGHSATVTQGVDPFSCADATGATCSAGTYPGGLGIASPNGAIVPRPDQTAAVHLTKTLAQWFSTSSFTDAVGHFGSERNGSFLGPGLQNWDLGAIKNIQFSERFHFQFRGEFFNAFNHTNYAGVATNIDNPATFGTVVSTHLPRRIQLGAKLYF